MLLALSLQPIHRLLDDQTHHSKLAKAVTKRKTNVETTIANNKRQRTQASEAADSSRLLQLPAELRNVFYTCVMAQESQGLLIPANPGKLLCKSALARTTRQIRAESTSLLHIAFTGVAAEVRNLNFGHVITWLNRLEAPDLQSLPTLKNVEQRTFTMTVKLTITEPILHGNGHNHLACWLNRVEHPDKNGHDIVIDYELDLFRSVEGAERTASSQLCLFNRLNGNFQGRMGEAIEPMMRACKAQPRGEDV